ncbi:MAG: NgoFVII family restriction endonuclease [Acidimicrobiales bacterium]|nr:NgoFVII family restriction endonuclease [Acidimicrobiales bacterium]MYA26665.1 NgoFVII family restriction endonuclease [Acidimicrobiales bacterium]MYD82225.1 NgoFVII family restriction endonuclease [Acidimicrobiales bacterium]MYG88588.1 NgoFVII family restriction endonuclease [Acidimicrobiales bacterium]MYI29386.1 NgoFVII family restriction endonuclease [Acidimicrobiales bacterium]
MPLILDNIDATLEAELLRTLASSQRLDAAVGYFDLRGWRLIADAVDALGGGDTGADGPKARILIGIAEAPQHEMRRVAAGRAPPRTDNQTATRLRDDALADWRAQLEVGVPTAADEAALRQLRRQIASGTVEMRLHTAHRLHAKLYLCHRSDTAAPRVGYLGSSNLTAAGLRAQGELNTDVLDTDAAAKLAAWFEDRWEDRFSIPVEPEIADIIEQSWAAQTPLDPYLVYLKMAYHLSAEARDGLLRFGLPASMEAVLLAFQSAATKIAARIVMSKGGAMVGDVVGLGKTLVGTSVARLLQEEHGFETLVACPKNLVPMWQDYLHRYEVRGRVMSLSMVHRELPDERRHRLVIVDEAHNLRNERRRDHRALRAYISDNESRVLLLSATPYNKGFGDLAAQLALFIKPEDDLGLRPERAIAAHPEGAGDYEYRLAGQSLSSLAAFRRSDHLEDWQALLSQYLVRRTRAFVEEHYASTDEAGRRFLVYGNGERFQFPRRTPVPVDRDLAGDDAAAPMATDATLDAIRRLSLPRYRLGDYLRHGYRPVDDAEQQLIDDLANAGRGNLSGFTRIMMYKRLSSSGPAFLATLRRHRLRNLVALHALDSGRPLPVGPVGNHLWEADTRWDSDGLDADDGYYETDDADRQADTADAEGGRRSADALFDETGLQPQQAYDRLRAANTARVRWVLPQAFLPELHDELRADIETIGDLLDRIGAWEPARDGKLAALERIVAEEHPAEKVLVFTEAADTANYAAAELARRGVGAVAAVTGSSGDPSALARRFSPRSSRAPDIEPGDELRVLVSTDVLSEGQNLQDARIVVNYDLPWAVVKLVQRAGRVDRIGQNAAEVMVYSLLPAGRIEDEIRLRERVRDRLAESAALLGSDEQFFGDASERRTITQLYDEHSDFRLGADAEDVDPVSMAYEIWRHAREAHPDAAAAVEVLPNVVHATKRIEGPMGTAGPRGRGSSPSAPRHGAQAAPDEAGSMVVVHSRTVTGSDAFAAIDAATGDAHRITPQEALRRAECEPATPPAQRLGNHHELVAAALTGPLRTASARTITSLSGVRAKVWNTLHAHMGTFDNNLLFSAAELSAAHDLINEHPLLESATQRLSGALRDRTPADLAALVVDLWRDERLCEPPPQTDSDTTPSIICSMGLR